MAFAVACGDSGQKQTDGGAGDAKPDGSSTGGVGGRAGAGGNATGGAGGLGGSPATGGAGGLGGKGGTAGNTTGGAGGATGGAGGSTGGIGGTSTGGAGGLGGKGGAGGSAGAGGVTPTGGTAGSSTGGTGGAGGTPKGGTGAGGLAGQGGVGAGGVGGGAVTIAHVTGWVDSLDFGFNPCGGLTPPAPKTFTLTNSGGTAAKITAATVSGATAYTTDALNKSIPANGTLVVTVSAPTIPTVSAVPGNYAGTLTFQTDVTGDTSHAVALTEAASGAILTLEAASSFGSFGSVSAGSTARQTFRIINTGNADAMLTAGTSSPFVLDQTAISILKGQSFDDAVTFDASSPIGLMANGHTAKLSFVAGTAVCGSALADVSLTANTLNGGVVLSTGGLTFYPTCNDPSPAGRSFSITNTGNAAITFTPTILNGNASVLPALGSPVSVPAADLVNPGQNVGTVSVTPLVATSSAILTDALTITTSGVAGDSPHVVSLTTVPQGDVVSVSLPEGTDFGQVPIINPPKTSAIRVVFRNDANTSPTGAVARVTLTNDNPALFSLNVPTFTLASGQSAALTITFAPGTNKSILNGASSKSFLANIGWSIGSDANCAGSAGSSGTLGFQATATAAEVSVSPPSLVFGNGGLVNCGAQAQPLAVTLSNPGANAYTVSNVQVTGAYFDAVLSNPVVLPAGSGGTSQTITVTPRAIPATLALLPDGTTSKPTGTFNGSLSFQTDAPNDSTHTIPLYMGAKGVIISGAPPQQSIYSFQSVAVGSQSYYNLPIVNAGNATAQASFRSLNFSSVFGITPSPTIVQTGTPGTSGDFVAHSTTLNLFYKPVLSSATDNDTIYLTVTPLPGEVFCQPLPTPWVNIGQNGVAVVGSSLAQVN